MKPENEKKIVNSLKMIKAGLICSSVCSLYFLIIITIVGPFPLAVALAFFCQMFALNKMMKDVISSEKS